MNHVFRFSVLAGCLIGLSGCNLLVSEEPWFTAADAQPRPVLRDGLWVSTSADCRFNEAKPAERWPDCAVPSFVRGDELWLMTWEEADAHGRRRRIFGGWELADQESGGLPVVNGDHLIVQYDKGAEPPPSDELDEAAANPNAERYMYSAMRILSRDERGKVTALESWNVQCGPISEPELTPARRRRLRGDPEFAEEPNNVTDQPFPGLTVVESHCIAEDVAAVRSAAALSEAIDPPTQTRWIREGWH